MYIYDKANELAKLIRESEEYKNYSSLKDEIMKDETNKALLKDYKRLQFEAEASYMGGKEPSQEAMEKIKKLGEILQFNPKMTEFFAAEYKFNTLITDIYKIIGEACSLGDFGLDFLQNNE